MKKSIALKAMTLAVSTLSAGATMAGTSGVDPSGLQDFTAGRPHLVISHNNLYANGFVNTSGTATAPNGGGSYTTHYNTRSASNDLWNTTITCTGDNLDASGNLDVNDLDVWGTVATYPWNNGSPLAVVGTSMGDLSAAECAVTVGATGQITGGYQVADPFPIGPSLFVISINLYDPAPDSRYGVTLRGACPTDAASNIPIAELARDTLVAELDAGNSLAGGDLETIMNANSPGVLPAGCFVNGVLTISVGNCDDLSDALDCAGGSAKAVPVPAFAAATLALGLAGVTYLSGRRRVSK